MTSARLPRFVPFAALALVAAACGPTVSPTADGGLRIRGLAALPSRLPFTCVTPGCDETQTTVISVMGDRRLAIKRVILQGDTHGEFTVTPSQAAPFILGGTDARFTVDVRFAPKGAPASSPVNLLVTFTDASPDESPDRVPPGDLLVPLVRRLVGEPVLEATPRALSFGAVPVSTTKSVSLEVRNAGFGNVSLELLPVDAGVRDLVVGAPSNRALVADAGAELPLTFSPKSEQYLHTTLTLAATSPEVDPVTVELEGTSVSSPRFALEPDDVIDFGEVPRRQSKVLTPVVVNQGGHDLYLTGMTLTDGSGNLSVQLPDGGAVGVLPPLGRMPLTVLLAASDAGVVNGSLRFALNETGRPEVTIPITGTVTEPRLQATPSSLDWGTVPQGWAVTKPLELRNVGYGALTVKNIIPVTGSSTLFTLKNVPTLPFVLDRNQRVALEVEFRAQTGATFAGSVSVETNDPVTPFAEVPLTAVAGTCAAGCPIANGTPTCQAGACAIGSCNASWFDVDGQAANGCECKEPGSDPGSICSAALNKGNFKDGDGRHDNVTGIVPTADDVDLIRFHAEDAFQAFSDAYSVNVSLSTTDPGISMCVYRYDTGTAQTDCYYSNESCGRSFHKGGGIGGDDADYVIKIFRTTGSTLTCTPYTVFFSNG